MNRVFPWTKQNDWCGDHTSFDAYLAHLKAVQAQAAELLQNGVIDAMIRLGCHEIKDLAEKMTQPALRLICSAETFMEIKAAVLAAGLTFKKEA